MSLPEPGSRLAHDVGVVVVSVLGVCYLTIGVGTALSAASYGSGFLVSSLVQSSAGYALVSCRRSLIGALVQTAPVPAERAQQDLLVVLLAAIGIQHVVGFAVDLPLWFLVGFAVEPDHVVGCAQLLLGLALLLRPRPLARLFARAAAHGPAQSA